MASAYMTAAQVGSYFVTQYYQMLQQSPEFVHKLYSDVSTMIRIDGQSKDTGCGMMEEFKQFGKVGPEGVAIRRVKAHVRMMCGIRDTNVCYAFVDFEDITGAQNAIQAATVQVSGHQVMSCE